MNYDWDKFWQQNPSRMHWGWLAFGTDVPFDSATGHVDPLTLGSASSYDPVNPLTTATIKYEVLVKKIPWFYLDLGTWEMEQILTRTVSFSYPLVGPYLSKRFRITSIMYGSVVVLN